MESSEDFKSDPLALASILSSQGLTPKLRPRAFEPSLTPAANLPKRLELFKKDYEFFEGRNGGIFWRQKADINADVAAGVNPGHHSGAGPSSNSGGKKRKLAFERGIMRNAVPRRMGVALNALGSPSKGSTNKPKLVRRSMMPIPSFGEPSPLPHRQSISERKPAQNASMKSLLYGYGSEQRDPLAKKTLSFGDETKKKIAQGSAPKVSMAERVLVQNNGGLAFLPGESYSDLLRQSLSRAELDRMLEDDSTANFENFEMRLKTPAKLKERRVLPAPVGAFKVPAQPAKKTSALPLLPPIEEARKCEVEENHAKEDEEETPKDDLESDGDVEEDLQVLERSLSMIDLRSLPGAEDKSESNEEKADQLDAAASAVLKRCASSINLDNPKERINLEVSFELQNFVRFREERIRQQSEVEAEMKRLMDKAEKRREAFRQAWGVSPRSVNKLRTVKTIQTGPLNVSFSEDCDAYFDANPPRIATDDPADEIFAPVVVQDEDFGSVGDEAEDIDAAERRESSATEELCDSDENIEVVDMDISKSDASQPTDEQPTNSNEEKKGKSVRFSNATPVHEKARLDASLIQVSIPVRLGRRSGQFSLNESCSSSVLFHKATPFHPKAKPSFLSHDTDDVSASASAAFTTPMVLRNISASAKAQQASLYDVADEDSPSEHETSSGSLSSKARDIVPGKIDFDDEYFDDCHKENRKLADS